MATTSLGFPVIAGADPNVYHYDFVEALTGSGESSFVNLADKEIDRRSIRHAMSAAEWASSDIVMRAGEVGYETDTGKFRVGDGVNVWTALSDPIPEGVLFADGHVAMTGALDMGGNKVTGVGAPSADTDVATVGFVNESIDTALVGNYVHTNEKGAAGGVAELDENGRVLSGQLPSYVDDVEEYASESAFPATGESGKIYIAADNNLTFRWSGTQYVEISPSVALGETSATAYRGDRGKTAYDHSQITDGNPHGTDYADVGAVPAFRTINGHELSTNVTLDADDVGARSNTWLPTTSDIDAVPITRTVNTKPLSADVVLDAADVGARSETWIPSAVEIPFEPGNTGLESTSVQAAIEEVLGDSTPGRSISRTYTIPADAWVAGEAVDGFFYYEATVTDADVAASDMILATPGDRASMLEITKIYGYIETGDGYFKLLSDSQHEVAITIQYEICKTVQDEQV